MKVLVASNDDAVSQRIRDFVRRNLEDCPDDGAVELAIAAGRAEMLHPDLVVVVMGAKPETSIDVVKAINQSCSAYLACVGPATDGKMIIRALHEGGADQYLDITNLESELKETLEEVRSRGGTGPTSGQVTVLLGASGGCGNSTLAVNVAAVLAKAHFRCALLDFDVDSGDLASLLDLSPTQNLGDFCQNLKRLDRGMFEQMFAVHESGIHLLASPRSFGEPCPVDTDGLRQAVLMARSVFPSVVIDLQLESGYREVEEAVLRLADHILLVFRMDFTSLRNIRQLIARLERLGIDRDRIDYVANRFGQPHDVQRAMAESVIGFKITHFIPNDPSSINRANNEGVPIVLKSTWSTIGRSIYSMAGSLNGQAQPAPKVATVAANFASVH